MVDLNQFNFESTLTTDLPVLVDVYADWCPPCRKMLPLIKKLDEELAGKALVAKLDSDASPELTGRLKVDSLPTFIAFRGGVEVKRLSGVATREQLVAMLGL